MLTLSLAACHGRGGPPAIGNVAAPAPRVDLMAGLFAGPRPLVYEVTQVESHWDRHDPAAAPDGMVTTTATNQVTCDLVVARLGRYRTATIACDDDGDGATIEAPTAPGCGGSPSARSRPRSPSSSPRCRPRRTW